MGFSGLGRMTPLLGNPLTVGREKLSICRAVLSNDWRCKQGYALHG
jgi:hypothetical protein